MIFADKIINLRKKYGFSQEELAEKIGVSRQAVSKWESAQSVPDLDKVLLMSKLFGVTTDYLLKDEMEIEETSDIEDTLEEPKKKVTLAMANDYLGTKFKTAKSIAIGVALCIMSPVMLILLGGMSDIYELNENVMCGIGLIVMLILVAIAVALFVSSWFKVKDYEFLENEQFETEYGVTGLVKERKKDYKEKYYRSNLIGVILCILCVVPIFIALFTENELYSILGLVLMFITVSIGVSMMVHVGCKMGAMDRLLQEGEFTKTKKEENFLSNSISSCYWILVTAIYLLWSFLSSKWEITWIIWPIAGVLYGGLFGIIDAISKNKKKK